MILELGSEMISDKLPNSSINSYFNWENQINWNGILLNSWVPELHGRFIHANVVRRPRRVIQKINIQIFIGFTTLFSYACFLLGWFFRLEKGNQNYINRYLWWNVRRCTESKWSNVYFPYASYHVFTGHVISLDVTWRSGMIKTIWKCLDTLSM